MKKILVTKGYEIYEAEEFEFDGYSFGAFKLKDGPDEDNYCPIIVDDSLDDLVYEINDEYYSKANS